MTKRQPKGPVAAIAAAITIAALLCCGGVTLNSAFNGDDEPAESPAATPTTPAAPRVVNIPALPAITTGPTETTTTAVPKRTTAKPKPTTKKPRPAPTTEEPEEVYYENCAAVRAAGAAPIHRGDPGYAKHLDRDGDGVGCE